MRDEPAINQELETERPAMTRWEARMVFCGVAAAMASGSLISPELIKSLDEAVEVLDINNEEDKKQKPPRPPRRPNIPVGRVALGNT